MTDAPAPTDMVIVYRDPRVLKPYDRNSRTHSPEQILKLRASIREFSFRNPVLLRDDDTTIGAGHGRVEAAIAEGLERIPTITLHGLSDAQWRAYVITDNRLALDGGWDLDLLKSELIDLSNEGFDLELTGMDLDELSALMDEPKGKRDPEALPDLPLVPTSLRGDVWILGDHRLMCGDSTSAADVQMLMEGEQADMLFTDPPWNVNYGANLAGGKYKDRSIQNDHMTTENWAVFVDGFTAQFRAGTKPGAPAYVVMSAQEWPVVDGAIRRAGFHWSSSIIWVKDSLVLSRKDYHTRYEPIWYGWNDAAPRLVQLKDRKQDDVWEIPRPKASELHPTTKPVELIERALQNSSNPKALILDLFGGSGSTLIACQQQGRRARLMELDEKYVDVICVRWQQYSGENARLNAPGGPTFEEVRALRTAEAI